MKSTPKFIAKYKMLIQIIKYSSFSIAKTLFQITKKCLNNTLNADLSQGESYNVKKRCERAGVRLRHDSCSPCGAKAVFGIPAVYFVSDLLPQIRKKVYFAVHAIGEIR